MTVALVACGQAKRSTPAPARELYTGAVFKVCSRAAQRIADRWYILSAKHGLLAPSEIVVPYDASLPAEGDPEWGARVLAALREREPDERRFIALCSARYLTGWAQPLGAETPLKGLRLHHFTKVAHQLRRS